MSAVLVPLVDDLQALARAGDFGALEKQLEALRTAAEAEEFQRDSQQAVVEELKSMIVMQQKQIKELQAPTQSWWFTAASAWKALVADIGKLSLFGVGLAVLLALLMVQPDGAASRSQRDRLLAVASNDAGWITWQSSHPNETLRSQQHVEYQELTSGIQTGLTGGLLRIPPNCEVPRHWHTIGEAYYFLEGSGLVHVGMQNWSIQPGLFVNIPPRASHGIDAGKEGALFHWMFPGQRWSDIAYNFEDPQLHTIWR